MGAACACSEVESAKQGGQGTVREQGEDSELSDDGSEVDALSDEDSEQDGLKKGVSDVLVATGKHLQRGKTMAMKEAIAAAKKAGVESSKISAAEKLLEEHKRQQRRDEVEQEVHEFSKSAAYMDMEMVDKMIQKAVDTDCAATVLESLEMHLEELNITRPLEDEEHTKAREHLRQSCRELVLASTREFGMPVTLLQLADGVRSAATLTLDPPLLHIGVAEESGAAVRAPIHSLKVLRGKDDRKVSKSAAFTKLKLSEQNCILAIWYEDHGRNGIWTLIEPTGSHRDRLVEAVSVLVRTAMRPELSPAPSS